MTKNIELGTLTHKITKERVRFGDSWTKLQALFEETLRAEAACDDYDLKDRLIGRLDGLKLAAEALGMAQMVAYMEQREWEF